MMVISIFCWKALGVSIAILDLIESGSKNKI